MSWDVYLLKEKFDLNDENYEPKKIGKRDEIIKDLTRLLPNINFSDKSWGILNESDFSIEFNTGEEEDIDVIALHIRGGGNPLKIIKLIVRQFGWGALDCSKYEFIDIEKEDTNSWENFQEYRDKVLKKYKK